MATNQIYEGIADLDIRPFLKGVKSLETAIVNMVKKTEAQFVIMENQIDNSLTKIENRINQFKGNVTSGQSAGKGSVPSIGGNSGTPSWMQADLKTMEAAFKREQDRVQALGKRSETETKVFANRIVDNIRTLSRGLVFAKQLGVRDIQKFVNEYQKAIDTAMLQLSTKAQQLTKQIEANRLKAQQSLSSAEASKTLERDALIAGSQPIAERAKAAYQQQINAAKIATTQEAALMKELTAVHTAQRAIQVKAAELAAEKQMVIAKTATQKGFSGFFNNVIEDFNKTINRLKAVEDKVNSIFRAGSQISSIGQQMSFFAVGIGAVGAALTKTASDFDFWIRRTMAANQAAGGTINTFEQFANAVNAVGRDVGALSPDQVAESLMVYQTALGTAINDTNDLALASQNLDVMLKAAIITNTDHADVIRGVSQVLSIYGMGLDKISYVTSVMMNVTSLSQAEFKDVIETFSYLGPQSNKLGVEFDQMAAAVARLADMGFKGSSSGRALAMMFQDLLDPSTKASKELQQLLVTNLNLKGAWTQTLAPGGEFLNLLDTVNEKGQKQTGLLHLLAQATAGMTEAQRAASFSKIFDANVTKDITALVGEYVDEIKGIKPAAQDGKQSLQELYTQFSDPQQQLANFGLQWEQMENTIKVRLGRAQYVISSSLDSIGAKVAEAAIPMLQFFAALLAKFSAWAEAHPQAAQKIMTVVGVVGLLLGVLGPLLFLLGTSIQGLATIPTLLVALATPFMFAVSMIRNFVFLLVTALPQFLLLAAAAYIIYQAWQTNFAGMKTILNDIGKDVKNVFGGILNVVIGIFQLILAALNGDAKQLQAAMNRIGAGVMQAFFFGMAAAVSKLVGSVVRFVVGGLQLLKQLKDEAFTWGGNFIISFAEGIAYYAMYPVRAILGIIESIAALLEGHSPPKEGKLKGIFDWGKNLIETYLEGANAADIGAIDEITSKIGEAIQANVNIGGLSEALVGEATRATHEIINQMMYQLRTSGQTVEREFFEPLRSYLGEWYEYVVDILDAYQEYALITKNIELEEKRLEVIRLQREELERQNKLRQDLFDLLLDSTSAGSFEQNRDLIIDPTTEAGKATIEDMKAALSPEEFQNWINFQKRLWDQQTKTQDMALSAEQSAAESRINAYRLELTVIEQQYETAVALFDYLQKITAPSGGASGRGGGGGGGLNPNDDATLADLEEARRRVRAVVGQDEALRDEKKIAEDVGGDPFAAIGEAARQADREKQRIADLDAENRRKKAEFDIQKIQAQGNEEELARIKAKEEAWDAAYREEKARLQERLDLANQVSDATEEERDRTKGPRVSEQESKFADEIKNKLGEHNKELKNANELKQESKNLEEAQAKAREQLREEERARQDLEDLGAEKRLEFEKRIDEAAGDEEKIARIKEEQEAWERAYEAALLAQKEREEASRRAEQDLGDEAGGKGGKDKTDIPDFPGGGVGLPKMPDISPDKILGDLLKDFNPDEFVPPFISTMMDDIKKLLGEETVVPEEVYKNFDKIPAEIKRQFGLVQSTYEAESKNTFEEHFKSMKRGWQYVKEKGIEVIPEALGEFERIVSTGWIGLFEDDVDLTGPNSPMERLRRGWNKLFGSDSESIPNVTEMAANNIRTAITKVFGISEPEGVSTVVGTGVDAIKGYILQTFGLEQPDGAPTTIATGLGAISQYMYDVFGIESPTSVSVVANMGLTEFMKGVVQTFGPEEPQSIVGESARGLTSVQDLFSGKLTTDKDSIVNTVQLGLGGMQNTVNVYFGENENSAPNIFNSAMGAIQGSVIEVAARIRQASLDLASGGVGGGAGEPTSGNAFGLFSVPFDNYIARLHKGEKVLTAAQAKAWDRLQSSGMFEWLYGLQDKIGAIYERSERAVQRTAPINSMKVTEQVFDQRKTQENNIYVNEMNVNDEQDVSYLFNRLSALSL